MKTLLEILNLTTRYLEQKGFQNAKRQAQELISKALCITPMELYLDFERPLLPEELDKCRSWLARRAKHEPVAYIDGKVEFLDCQVKVSKDVLIPRPETEILADKVSRYLSSRDLKGKVLWDICTGSGCLGIAIKRKSPELKVVLSDISPEALKLAKSNAELNSLEVECVQGDLLDPFKGLHADFVVCNPPYISEKEYKELDVDVRDYEPRCALVGGVSGLEYYQRLANQLPAYLNRSGKVWLEIGNTQGVSVGNLFDSTVWKTKILEKDWAGWDRFFFLEIE